MRLILLIGLPGSGKSTFAALRLQACPQRQLISTDAIRSCLFGDEAVQENWLKVWREVGRQFQQTVQQGRMEHTSEAIYDATNAVRRDRRRAIGLARTCGFTDITGVWLNTPLDICLQRNQQRYRRVPDAVILRMHRRLMGAPPSVSDGCDRLIEVSW
ncbi:AAA family ATPase [Stenomitos frigidus]|uniref:AAA family ATPase n=1 Tax=Stenomitos frigidus ULC18 TaxID=2107698 RepID=A0A2T1EGV0_9CYAN|nr:AAA family ATPase [Stenomitos frigidus]PSB31921.1 AAA family ATPase [Stenomitos frigidus ULC18]